jgi:hypothetical protein
VGRIRVGGRVTEFLAFRLQQGGGEHLVHLGHGPQQGNPGLEVGPEAKNDLLGRAVGAAADRGEHGDAQVVGQVDGPEFTRVLSQEGM